MSGILEGRVAIITGAGRGIGREHALMMAAQGAKIVVNDLGAEMDGTGGGTGPAGEVVEEIRGMGGEAVVNGADVSDWEAAQGMINQAIETFGRLDILVNNAGILRDRMLTNMTEEEWDAVIRTHLYGHFNTIKPASILMRQQRGGRIINFSSISGLQGGTGQANYGAAKGGIAALTRVIARDLGRYGVTCNAIAPGAQTRMTQSVPDSARQLRARAGIAQGGTQGQAPGGSQPVELRQPEVPNLHTAEHVAPMTVWLCTPEAWNVNGKIFHVAGGTVGLAHEEVPANTINRNDMWTLDELATLVPSSLMRGIQNPAPPAPDLDLPYRPAVAPPPSA